MSEQLRLDPSQIDPDRFKHKTTWVETLEEPIRGFVAGIHTLLEMTKDGRYVTTLRQLTAAEELPELLVVSTEVFLNGGDDNGFRLPGFLEEFALTDRQHDPDQERLIGGLPPRLWMFPG